MKRIFTSSIVQSSFTYTTSQSKCISMLKRFVFTFLVVFSGTLMSTTLSAQTITENFEASAWSTNATASSTFVGTTATITNSTVSVQNGTSKSFAIAAPYPANIAAFVGTATDVQSDLFVIASTWGTATSASTLASATGGATTVTESVTSKWKYSNSYTYYSLTSGFKTITDGANTWLYSYAAVVSNNIIINSGNYIHAGHSALALDGSNRGYIITPLLTGIASVSFYARTNGPGGAIEVMANSNTDITNPANTASLSKTFASAANGSITTQNWSGSYYGTNGNGSNSISSGGWQQISFTTNIPSNSSAYLKIQNYTNGGTEVYIDDIVITQPAVCNSPAITSVTAPSSSICSSATQTLTATGVAGTNAVTTWWTGTGGTGSNLGTGTTLTNRGPGTYYAQVTADCGSPAEASITITAKTNVAITSVTAPNSSICASGANQTLTANGVAGTNAVTTWWTGSGGTGSNLGTGTTLTNQGPGTYYARVTGDCGSPVEASLTVNTLSSPSISAENLSGSTYTQGDVASALSVTASGGGTITYQWYSSDDNSKLTSGDDHPVGTNSDTYTPLTTVAGTLYYYCVVSGCTPNAISNLSGAIVVNPATSPTIVTNQSGFDGAFGNYAVNGTTAPRTFIVSGTNLTNDIAISAPTGFQVSTSSGSGYGSSVTLTQSGGIVSNTTIYVHFVPVSATSYSGNIALTSFGATDVNIPVSGTGIDPSISLSSSSDINFTVTGWTNSSPSTITVNGSYLLTDISVSVGTPFQVSNNGSSWATTTTLTQSSGTVSNATLYIRYNPSSGTGSDNSTVTLSSTGATNKTFNVTGKAAPTVTLSSGSSTQTKKGGIAITNIVYTVTGGVTSATCTGLPTGVTFNSSTYTISGTPTTTTYQAYPYTVTINGVTGTTAATATGTITVVNPDLIKIAYVTKTATLALASDALYQHLFGVSNYSVTAFDQADIGTTKAAIEANLAAYDMVVIGEPVDGTNANVLQMEGMAKPMVNSKHFTYSTGRWVWGTPANGSSKISTVTVQSTTHPIFKGLTFSGSDVTLLNSATADAKAIGNVTSMTFSGSQTLAYSEGSAANIAIQEVPVGTTYETGKTLPNKYIMIAINNLSYQALTADGFLLFDNAINYVVDRYPVYATTGSNGTISPLGVTYYNSGANKDFTITSNSGKRILTLSVDGTSVPAAIAASTYTYTFSNITTGHTIAVTFETIPCSAPVIGTNPNTTPQSFCLNGTVTTPFSVSATGSGTVSYQWEKSTSPTFASGITSISGATTNSYLPLTTVAGTLYYHCIVTNDCGSGATSTSTSNISGGVTVNNVPTAYAGDASTTIFANGTYIVTNAAVSNNSSLVWSSTDPTGIFSPSNSTLNPSYAPGNDDITNGTATLTLTAISLGGCADVSDSKILTITPVTNTITTNTISGSPFCAGTNVSVPFTATGTFTSGNIFNAQLSDENGDFTAPVVIGSVTSVSSGTISAIIPANTITGNGYRIRVASTTPAILGDQNTTDITINALPTVFTVTGGGAYCAGGTGVAVGLSASESGIDYQLKIAGNNITVVSGTGSAISFGNQTATGAVTVVASNTSTSCTSNMTSSVSISTNPLPTVFTVTGGGAYCSGGTGVTVGLGGSQSGINYQLNIAGNPIGSPVAGTNSAISFGNQTAAGAITVVAINATTSCTNNMTSSASITINALPTAYSVTAGGSATSASYCTGGAGVDIQLSNSETGVYYQLKRNSSTNVGSPLAGTTGNVVDFGNQTVAGTYTVVAINATTTCTAPMTNSPVITINAPSITLTSAAPTESQTVAKASAITNITYLIGGGATTATVTWTNTASPSTPPSGISVNISSLVVTISGSPSATGTFAYTVTTDGCAPATDGGTITSTLSNAKDITAFTFTDQVGSSTIGTNTIAVTMPAGTYRYSLTPSGITTSANASVNPAYTVAQDFRSPVVYTVTAENGSTKTYTVTVTNQPPACSSTFSFKNATNTNNGSSGALTTEFGRYYLDIPGIGKFYRQPSAGSSLSLAADQGLCETGGQYLTTTSSTVTIDGTSQSSKYVQLFISPDYDVTGITLYSDGGGTGARTLSSIATLDKASTYNGASGNFITLSGTTLSGTTSASTCSSLSFATASGTFIPKNTYILIMENGSGIRPTKLDINYSCSSTTKLISPLVTTGATAIGNTGFTANWSNVSNEIGYKLEVFNSSNAVIATINNIAANTTSQVVTGLSTNTNYTYKVTALGDGDIYTNSDPSGAAAFTTLSCTGYTWIGGGTTSSITDGTNWQCGTAPSLTGAAITVTPGATLTLSTDASFANITMGTGSQIAIGAHTLTLTGTVSGGEFVGSSSSNLVISAAAGTLNFATGGQVLHNLTLSGSATLGTPLYITAGSTPGTVTVNTGATLTTGGNLTIGSNFGGTARIGQSSGTISGAVTVERYSRQNVNRGWRLLSVPVDDNESIKASWQEGATAYAQDPHPGYGTRITANTAGAVANGFDAQTPGNSLLTYNPAGVGSWTGFTSNLSTSDISRHESADAWMLYVRGDRGADTSVYITTPGSTVLRVKGNLYQAPYPIVSVAADKNGLIGNILPSEIDFLNVTKTGGITDAFYVWDPQLAGSYGLGGYVIFSAGNPMGAWYPSVGGGSYPDGVANTKIQSGMGFFVHAGGSGGTVQLTEASKSGGTNSGGLGFRPARPAAAAAYLQTKLLAVSGATESLADANIIGFDNSYSNDYNDDDIVKIAGFGDGIGILRGTTLYGIEQRQPVVSGDVVPFKLTNLKKQVYKLSFNPSGLSVNGTTAVLEDKYLNTVTPLNLNAVSSVSFNADPAVTASFSERFRVVFTVPTPVTITNLKAQQKNAGMQIDWKVAVENSVKQYEVEHSTDGTTFSTAGTVSALGNNGGAIDYSFTDVNPVNGANYYRIKTIDLSGNVKYTAMVKVTYGGAVPSITLSNTLITNNHISLQLINQPKGKYGVRLVNTLGQELLKTSIEHEGGNSTQSLNLSSLVNKGVYQLEIVKPNNTKQIEKIVVN